MQNRDDIQVYYVRVVEAGPDGKPQARKGLHPVACVALKRTEAGVARGISICARTDNWCRKEGRNRAIKRLRRAIGCQCNAMPIGEPVAVKGAEKVVAMNGDEPVYKNGKLVMVQPTEPRQAGIDFHMVWAENYGMATLPGYKSAWNPKLTSYETTLLDIADQREAEVKAGIAKAVEAVAVPAKTAAMLDLAPEPKAPATCQCCHGCSCMAHD